jgi:hypothetical protein
MDLRTKPRKIRCTAPIDEDKAKSRRGGRRGRSRAGAGAGAREAELQKQLAPAGTCSNARLNWAERGHKREANSYSRKASSAGTAVEQNCVVGNRENKKIKREG